jgi:hypothetical protein
MSISYGCNPPYSIRWPYRPPTTPLSITQNFVILILIIVQRNATQSRLFIILKVHSICFGCQPHPSSRVHKTVTTASDTGHIFCVATSLQRGFIILQVHSTCFGCQPHPSLGVHKTVTTASGTGAATSLQRGR